MKCGMAKKQVGICKTENIKNNIIENRLVIKLN